MADLFLPPWIRVAEAEWRLVDFTARSQTTLSGAQKRVSRGQRLACSLRFQNLDAEQRHALMAWVAALRGGYNTAILYDPANRQRGSFPGGEMFSNNSFAAGVTGWSTQNASLSVSQGIARITGAAGVGIAPGIYQSPALTQYVPYALRSMILDGVPSSGLAEGRFANLGAGVSSSDYAVTRGLGTVAFVPSSASPGAQFPFVLASSSGYTLGQTWAELSYASLQQCALVDNGPNLFTYSNTGSDASWAKTNVTAGDNGSAGPSGATDAQYLLETATTSDHYIGKSRTGLASDAGDYALSVSLHASLRSWAFIELAESVSGHLTFAYFNLATGALGTTGTTGANWANLRTFIVSEGSGWYRCTIVARKVSAATQVSGYIGAATANGTSNYAGSTASAAILWSDASLAQSSVPVRKTRTTTTSTTGSSTAGAGGVYVKGLPASTAGLVTAGDRTEVNGEMKLATASLDGDAAGLGYLAIEPVLRAAPADNAPVIIGQPTGRFVLTEDASWQTRPGMFSDFVLPFIEA